MKSPPPSCPHCPNTLPDHWIWKKDSRYNDGGTFFPRCLKNKAHAKYRDRRNSDPEKRKAYLQDMKERYEYDRLRYKLYSYKSFDRRYHPQSKTVNRKELEQISLSPCYYCKSEPSNGIDRKDSSEGHHLLNIVPCCEKCNMILGDLPFAAKEILGPALEKIAKAGLITTWVIPIKRRSYRK